jgi:hypothetical protein
MRHVKGRYDPENLCLGGKVILKWVLGKYRVRGCGLDETASG